MSSNLTQSRAFDSKSDEYLRVPPPYSLRREGSTTSWNQDALSNSHKEIEMNGEALIDAEAAGQLLGLHPKTVKRLSAEGVIPGMRIGKLWRYRASILDEWTTSQINCSRHPLPSEGEQ